MTEMKTAEQLAGEIKADFDTRFNALKAVAEDAVGKAARGETMNASTKEQADQAITAVNEAKARLDEIEQKLARTGERGNDAVTKSLGQQVTEDDSVKALLASGKGRARVETKAIISSLTTLADGSAGDMIVPLRVPGVVASPQRRMTIRDLLMPGRTSQPSIQYVKETGYTNSAATVSETSGATKPQSEIQFDLMTAAVTTIAHFVLATRQIMDDVPMLQSYIDGRLRYGLALIEEAQLLTGSGTGTNLNGIYTQATTFAAGSTVIGSSASRIDALRYAMLQAALAEYPPSGITLHHRDWAEIETLKDTQGRYIIGDPKADGPRTIWGLPVVETQAMAAGTFLVGAFSMGAQIFDRADATVEISTEDSDNFRKNLVTILAEERLALAVYRPEAFIKGTFAAAITDLTT